MLPFLWHLAFLMDPSWLNWFDKSRLSEPYIVFHLARTQNWNSRGIPNPPYVMDSAESSIFLWLLENSILKNSYRQSWLNSYFSDGSFCVQLRYFLCRANLHQSKDNVCGVLQTEFSDGMDPVVLMDFLSKLFVCPPQITAKRSPRPNLFVPDFADKLNNLSNNIHTKLLKFIEFFRNFPFTSGFIVSQTNGGEYCLSNWWTEKAARDLYRQLLYHSWWWRVADTKRHDGRIL